MVQQIDKPPVKKPAPVTEDFDGAFGFFRKYQKAILYSAGLFTLVTFSVTGALLGLFDNLFRRNAPQPTIVVNGKRHDIDDEDRQFGVHLAQVGFGGGRPVVPVLPGLVEPDDVRSSDLQNNLAILRRAAIAEGLDVSMAEVDRCIKFTADALTEQAKGEKITPTRLAQQVTGSLAQFRLLVKEAMRIGNYVRMLGLSADTTDAAVIASILRNAEKITVRDAYFDGKALLDELKKGTASDEDLHKFLDGKDDTWKMMHQVFDTNRVSLQLGVCDFQSFDPGPWADTLQGLDLSDDTLFRLYEETKDPAFKLDAAKWQQANPGFIGPLPQFTSFNDLRDELQKRAKAQKVMDELLRQIRDQRDQAMKAANEAMATATNARNQAQIAADQAKAKAAEKPDDGDLKRAQTEAETALAGKKAEAEAAEKALTAAREGFDFAQAFTALTKGQDGKPRPGFAVKEIGGRKNADELKQLPDGLGEWKAPTLATSLMQNGELGSAVARTDKALFVFKATELVLRPLKAWDDIKGKLVDEYWLEQSQTQTKQKQEAFAKALLELGKGKAPEQVASIEATRQQRIDKELASFDDEQRKIISRAKEVLDGPLKGKEGSIGFQQWKKAMDDAEAELGKKEQHQKDIEAKVKKELDAEIATEAKKHYGEVLDAAAQQAGFTVRTIGPYDRKLSDRPHFKARFDDSVVFLFSGPVKQLKAGECTELAEDASNRKWHLAVCDKVEPRTRDDITRKEFLTERDGLPFGFITFATERIGGALQQSFTKDALTERYKYFVPGADSKATGEEPKKK